MGPIQTHALTLLYTPDGPPTVSRPSSGPLRWLRRSWRLTPRPRASAATPLESPSVSPSGSRPTRHSSPGCRSSCATPRTPGLGTRPPRVVDHHPGLLHAHGDRLLARAARFSTRGSRHRNKRPYTSLTLRGPCRSPPARLHGSSEKRCRRHVETSSRASCIAAYTVTLIASVPLGQGDYSSAGVSFGAAHPVCRRQARGGSYSVSQGIGMYDRHAGCRGPGHGSPNERRQAQTLSTFGLRGIRKRGGFRAAP